TNNFRTSIDILEQIENLSPHLQEAYQTVTLRQANLDLKENRLDAALTHFNKSLQYTPSSSRQAEAYFWIGEILNRQKKYADSEVALNKYMALAKTNTSDNPAVNPAYAGYIQGYNYIRTGEHRLAIQSMQRVIEQSETMMTGSQNKTPGQLEEIVGDAYIRIGDNYFQLSQYNEAANWYQRAANQKVTGYDYALYQYAQILSLQGNESQQVATLDRMLREKPDSRYADMALDDMAVAQMHAT